MTVHYRQMPVIHQRMLLPFFFAATVLLCVGTSPVLSDDVLTPHFRINYGFGRGDSQYANETGTHFERAHQVYHETFGFKQIVRAGERYPVFIMSPLFQAKGKTGHFPGTPARESYIEINPSLTRGNGQELAQNAFHEYFHAVSNAYLPYAALLTANDVHAHGELWCTEGLSRLMQYWAVNWPNGIDGTVIDIRPSLTDPDPGWFWGTVYHSDKGWLRQRTWRSLRTYNNGYSAFLFWYFVACNQRVDFDSGRTIGGTNVAVLRRFWESMGRFENWGYNHMEQTRDAMNVALAAAPQGYNSFSECFAEFTRSLLFPNEYYGQNTPVSLLLANQRDNQGGFVSIVPMLGEEKTIHAEDCQVEEMGARYYKITNLSQKHGVEISGAWDRDSGYVLSIFPAGQIDELITLETGGTKKISAARANNTYVVLTRIPNAPVSGACTLTIKPILEIPPGTSGQLDVVFCIDTTGSMADDIEQVKKNATKMIGAIQEYCSSQKNKISFQIGLVTYQDHTDASQFAGKPEAAWLRVWPLTGDAPTIVNNIQAITIKTLGAGGDYPEDLYAAQMCAMDARGDWQNKPANMGWRNGAAKILVPMSDAPPHDPDFEGCTLQQVRDRAAELDPVHCYPLILPKARSSYSDPALKAMRQIAAATGGKIVRVRSASELPRTMVSTIKLAIRRHKEEIWRKAHPPYLLYGVLASLGFLALAAIGTGVVAQRRSLARRRVLASISRSSVDHTLTGESYIRPPDESHNSTRGEIQ